MTFPALPRHPPNMQPGEPLATYHERLRRDMEESNRAFERYMTSLVAASVAVWLTGVFAIAILTTLAVTHGTVTP